MPRILGLDIETEPALVYTFSLRDTTIGVDQIVDAGGMGCFSAKWFGEKKIHYADRRAGKKKMLLQCRQLMLEADAIVTYNGNGFDFQKINGEFVLNRIAPIPAPVSIDLWLTTNKLGYVSSKLAFVVRALGIGEKVKNAGMPLWVGCRNNDPKCWADMREYNECDTALLEEAHAILLPYIRNYPRLYDTGCPRDGETKVKATKYRTTSVYRFPQYQCSRCQGWYEGKRQSLSRAA